MQSKYKMDFKTITDTENPLFNRREIQGEIHADATPSREEVRKLISEKFSAPEDVIKIRTVQGKFGSRVFLIVANIYKSKDDMNKLEIKKKKDAEAEKRKEEAHKQDEESNKADEEEVKKTEDAKEEARKAEEKSVEEVKESSENKSDEAPKSPTDNQLQNPNESLVTENNSEPQGGEANVKEEARDN